MEKAVDMLAIENLYFIRIQDFAGPSDTGAFDGITAITGVWWLMVITLPL